MSSYNRPTPPSSSMLPNNRIRQQWPVFEKTVSRSRATMEHKVNAVLAKADADYNKKPSHQRLPTSQHHIIKAKLAKDIREPYFEDVRSQWQTKLTALGLRMEDWTDISNEEMEAVQSALGGDHEDESDEEIVVVPAQAPIPPTYSTPSLQSLAPPLSTSTRSTNVSTASSYAFVNPSEFNSEDEDHFFMPVVATSHDLTSDDDEGAGNPRPQHGFDAWSSDSSLQNSVASSSGHPFSRPPASGVAHNPPFTRMSSAKQQANAQSKSEKPSAPKAKVPRQPYIGPSVDDADEPLSDEEDFERFKMQIRIQKIVEFHQMAALADIQLAVAIYKDRKSIDGDKQEVSARVVDHQRRMSQLQMEKEEERKNVVKTERSKRRTELRRRPGRSATVIAPIPSVPSNLSWLDTFQDQATGDVESKFDIQKILSDDPNNHESSIESFLQQMFPEASHPIPSQADTADDSAFNQQYASPRPPGWGTASTSTQRASVSASQTTRPQFPRRRPSDAVAKKPEAKPTRVAKPSLFGDDDSSEEDDDEDEGDSSSPAPMETMNPLMNPDTGAFLSNQLLAEPEIAAALAQYGANNAPPPMPSWATPAAPSPPTTNLWASKDRSTPVASGWNRRKPSISTPQPSQTPQFFSPFGISEPSDLPPSLSAMATINSALAKGKAFMTNPFEQQQEFARPEPPKKVSPPTVPPVVIAKKSPVPTPTPPAAAKVEVSAAPPPASGPASKKMNKKQRMAMMKKGSGGAAMEEPEAEPELTPVLGAPHSNTMTTSEPYRQEEQSGGAASSFQDWDSAMPTPKMIPGMARVRKDSNAHTPFSPWDGEASTPRPPSKIPSHLQEPMLLKPEGTPRPNLLKKNQMSEMLSGASQNSTIKAAQWGAAPTGASARSAWSIFPSEAAPSKAPQQPVVASRTASRDPWVPGSFDVDDGGGDGGGGGGRGSAWDDGGEREQPQPTAQRFWTPTAASQPQQQPISAAQERLRRMAGSSASPAPPANAKTVPTAPPAQAVASPVGSKKAKGKKNGKGKKPTVEEVQDDEPDSRGESLPVDSRYIMEPKILEPRPSVPPTMYESIISFGDEDEDEDTTSSSLAPTPSTAPSSPPDPFDGDEARIAAAIKELQEGTSKMEKKFGGWNAGATKQHVPWTPSGSGDVETSSSSMFSPFGNRASAKPMTSTPVWSQLNSKDKGKAKMADLNGADDQPKVAANPTIQNLKRSKAAAGGKLF